MVWLSAFTMVIRCEPVGRTTDVGFAAGFVVALVVALGDVLPGVRPAVDPAVPVTLAFAEEAVADAPEG
jgi:hypothetical protein